MVAWEPDSAWKQSTCFFFKLPSNNRQEIPEAEEYVMRSFGNSAR